MAVLGVDIGGTKMALASFTNEGEIIKSSVVSLVKGDGRETGGMIKSIINSYLIASAKEGNRIESVGICVPGIYRQKKGTVWAPNIPGWDDYPLLQEVKTITGTIPVNIDSDRACYILGECWKGNARGCRDAIFMSIGTGIGAGIMIDGRVVRGSNDIAGATGWMALDRPYRKEYLTCGCYEYNASGEGIAKVTREYLNSDSDYTGILRKKPVEKITSRDVFDAYDANDKIAVKVIEGSIELWGMAVANFVSLFNPEKIILGGGVFGPAVKLIPLIIKEAERWAQPISITQVSIEPSGLGTDAGVYGAAYLALYTKPQ
ncbi:MAG TPA: ROK family protein [Bacteroidales bacterium]|nr:ROK family protein [Bacteroidales bacterium]HPT11763.1 ROK family protein [Bacteroidales bacterium]